MAIAESYYRAMAEKNITEMDKYLHPDVQFSSPLSKLTGKEAVLEAAKKFIVFFNALTIREKFSSEDQVMIVYNVDFPAPINCLPSSVLVTIKEQCIIRFELFFDASAFRNL